jgi:hypothetical protein
MELRYDQRAVNARKPSALRPGETRDNRLAFPRSEREMSISPKGWLKHEGFLIPPDNLAE